jgi:hypothetical protein
MLAGIEKARSESEQTREITVWYGECELCPSWHLEVPHNAATEVLQHRPHSGERLSGFLRRSARLDVEQQETIAWAGSLVLSEVEPLLKPVGIYIC